MDNESKPIAPRRTNMNKNRESSKSEMGFWESKRETMTEEEEQYQRDDNCVNEDTQSVTETKGEDSADINRSDDNKGYGNCTSLSNGDDQTQGIDNREATLGTINKNLDNPVENNKATERQENVKITADLLTSESPAMKRNTDMIGAQKVNNPERQQTACNKDLIDSDSSGSQTGNGCKTSESIDKDKDDYPDELNPFRDSNSCSQESFDYSDNAIEVENGPARQTVKIRPSLYPWRPFAKGINEYRSHMMPTRQTAKKRPSLYPWRPFGEEDYPEELNPFSDITEDSDNGKSSEDLGNPQESNTEVRSRDEQAHGKESACGPQPLGGVTNSNAEDNDDTDIKEVKKVGRCKKFCKSVKKKFGRFWNRIFRR